MTNLYDWLEIIKSAISTLPRSSDKFLTQLWGEGRLKYENTKVSPYGPDEFSSKLICSALHKKKKLLIVLPDSLPHRPALLFSCGLIMYGLDRIKMFQDGGRVLYFGTTIGIRDQIAKIKINRTSLDTVFNQIYLTKRTTVESKIIKPKFEGENSGINLPEVVCIYSPADPIDIIKRYQPDWIAIDCGVGQTGIWMSTILDKINEIPIVAWGQNALSSYVGNFNNCNACIFTWPNTLTSSFKSSAVTKLTPILIDGPLVQLISEPLRQIVTLLKQANALSTGRLSNDAIKIAWSLYYLILSLPIPYELYENENQKYWGIQSISGLFFSMMRFIEEIEKASPQLANDLENSLIHFDSIIENLKKYDPPIWDAVIQLCINKQLDETRRIIIFSSESRKEMFLYALLAKHNISEADLRELNVFVMSVRSIKLAMLLKDTSDSVLKYNENKIEYIIIGLMNDAKITQLEPLLHKKNLSFVIYPFQINLLEKQVQKWNEAFSPSISKNIAVILELGGSIPREYVNISLDPAIVINQKETIKTNKLENTLQTDRQFVWVANDPLHEVNWLLSEDYYSEEENSDLGVNYDATSMDPDNDSLSRIEPIWVEKALNINFDGGFSGLFALDDKINVVALGKHSRIEEHYVRSLGNGDNIIFIHGLRRQSLFELIISRIHNHPSMQIYIELISQWKSSVANAYLKWTSEGHSTIYEIYKLLKSKGSLIESPQSVQQWLSGSTMCPLDPEDLRRLAEILNIEFVINHYQRISKAASRLRAIHRSLAVRLNKWLMRYAEGIENDEENIIIDNDLGLTLNDFKDSLQILHINSIELITGPFSKTSLGRIQKREDVA